MSKHRQLSTLRTSALAPMEDGHAELGSTDRAPPIAADTPRLLVIAADGTWASRSLPAAGSLVIGRGAEGDVRIDDRAASRRHARLEIGRGGLRLVDLVHSRTS